MYVPLVKEAYNLWRQLEEASGKKLLLQTGGVILGSEDAMVIAGAKLSAETHGVPYEYLHSKEIKERFPAFKPMEETVAVVEKDAGILFPEACIEANLGQAKKKGATLLYNEVVTRIIPSNNSVEIVTNKGTYQTAKLIISAGAWMGDMIPELNLPLSVKRQVLFWFTNTNPSLQSNLLPEHLPIYIWEYKKGRIFYGFPDLGDGIKIAPHHEGQTAHPDLLTKEVSDEEVADMEVTIYTYLAMEARFHYSDVCMYTNTPDEHFIIDYHPLYKHIVIGSPCSGHGFKFSSLTGKILADMATDQPVHFNISPFKIGRFFDK
jgi:sarcosine oxidase